MKTKITIVIILTFCLGASVWSQGDPDRTRLMNYIQKTDEVITRAREAVMASGSERARNQLGMAVRLQKMASELVSFGSPVDDAVYTRAGRYTLSAREKAQLAIAITRQAAENEDYVQRRLEKTNDLIRQVEERVGDEIPEGLRLMLDSARDKQKRAEELFRNRRLKAALQMTLQVEKSLKEAIEKAGGYRRAQQRYEAQLDRYFTLRERIELGGLEDRPRVQQALKNTERLRAQAEETASNGRYGRAEKTMREAVEMMTRVAEKIREPMMVKTAMADVQKMAEHVRSQVDEFGDRKIMQQYQTARGHLDKAASLYDRGDYEGAAAQVQAARQIMTRVAETVEKPLIIEHGLEILRSLAGQLEGKVGASGDRVMQREYAGAREKLAKASALYHARDYDRAAAQMEMAERTLARIAHSLGE